MIPSSEVAVLALAFLLTLAWIAVHGVGFFLYVRRGAQPSRFAAATWWVAFIGGFTGPGVVLAALVAAVMALVELRRVARGEAPRASRLPCIVSLVSVLPILLMALTLVGWAVAASG